MSRMSIARPYAKAILLTTETVKDSDIWSKELNFLSQITLLPEIKTLIHHNLLAKKEVGELYLAIGKEQLSDRAKNLIRILAERKRLDYLPEIACVFEGLRNEQENKITVEVKSTNRLSSKVLKEIANSYEKKLNRQVSIQHKIDRTLLGGFVARAGNYVLDNSVRECLVRLKEAMGG